MRQTQLFTKTRKEAPADETSKNAKLLIRAGFVHKELAGVYSLLPLGLRVLNKIKKIVAKEMEALGSEELIMSSLQKKEVWETTDRWSDDSVDIWFKSKLKTGSDIGFGWSHEEPITDMMKNFVSSYSDLPRAVHQFQNKFRNETRAKSGLMRCREFVMKDMYSYSRNEEEHMKFYDAATEAYLRVYRTLGLGNITFVTSASGGLFTDKFSHEFQTLCDTGEDTVYVHKDGKTALNEEIFNPETLEKMGLSMSDFSQRTAAEVGNIFTFGTKKCEELGLYFTDRDGVKKPVFLGSYGIGVTRLLAVIAEVFGDEKGLAWPAEVAPFFAHLVRISDSAETITFADELYLDLQKSGIDVLYDDRPDVRAGEKFADSDLIGLPVRLVVSDKTVAAGKIEVKGRKENEAKMVERSEILNFLNNTKNTL
jgi:prolyl-tRNA synthetase